MSVPPRGCELWNFFTQISNSGYAICKICKKKLSYKTTTTNLKRHLKAIHPTISLTWRQAENQPLQSTGDHLLQPSESTENPDDPGICQPGPSTTSASTPATSGNINLNKQHQITSFIPKRLNTANQRRIDKFLLNMFIRDLQPFNIVEDNGFKDFVKALNPNYSFPDRKFISKSLIPTLFEECKTTCIEKLKKSVNISITTDSWTSQNVENFTAITAHFVNNFKLESILLGCTQIVGPHTSENIANHLKISCDNWGILNKINFVTTDNAANVKSAIIHHLNWSHVSCFAHNLNLIAKSSINTDSLNSLLNNIRIIIKHFKKSTTATEKLKNYQETTGRDAHALIHDVPTRWNSTYAMIDRFVFLEEPVKVTMAILNRNLPQISNKEWEILHELAVILKPIESATKVISGEKYPTASIIIPVVSGLQDIFTKFKDKHFSIDIQLIVENIQTSIDNRFKNIKENIVIQTCTFLDPRFKNAFFSSQQLELIKIEIANLLINDLSTTIQIENHVDPEPQSIRNENELSIWDALEENVKKYSPEMASPGTQILYEIEQYLRVEFYNRSGNPLIWWKDHQYQFPLLRKLVERLFCIVATSVPCERIFSKAGLILNDRRNRLKAEKLSMLLFLNHNT